MADTKQNSDWLNDDDFNLKSFGFDEESLQALKDLGIDDNSLRDSLKESSDPSYTEGYKVGYNSGFVEGFDEGQTTLVLEKENSIYNNALDDIIEHIDQMEFDKKAYLVSVLNMLRKSSPPPATN